MTHSTSYSKERPFFASIIEKRLLSGSGSNRNTFHLVLDLTGSGLMYEVGDSLGVWPEHAPELINKTLKAMRLTGEEKIIPKESEEKIPLRDFLRTQANITDINPKFLREVASRQTNRDKANQLERLLDDAQREEFKIYQEKHEVWDFLAANEEVFFSPQEFVDYLLPLRPRFYSISSSQKCARNEVHLTIASLEYESNGHKRRGVCTHFLAELVEEGNPKIPVFIQSSHGFRLPQDPHGTNLIMIGPGTGIAPFRAFLQERLLHHESKGKHWLFFGEQHRDYDFYYETEWIELSQRGHLEVDFAFSRDQEEKVYVQHKMWEKGESLYRWLEEGAYLYVCGDAQKMAKDVEKTLQEIIQEFGKKEIGEARDYIKKLRQQKRYLRDVY